MANSYTLVEHFCSCKKRGVSKYVVVISNLYKCPWMTFVCIQETLMSTFSNYLYPVVLLTYKNNISQTRDDRFLFSESNSAIGPDPATWDCVIKVFLLSSSFIWAGYHVQKITFKIKTGGSHKHVLFLKNDVTWLELFRSRAP